MQKPMMPTRPLQPGWSESQARADSMSAQAMSVNVGPLRTIRS